MNSATKTHSNTLSEDGMDQAEVVLILNELRLILSYNLMQNYTHKKESTINSKKRKKFSKPNSDKKIQNLSQNVTEEKRKTMLYKINIQY
jgi:hypothetical protein